MYLVGSVPLNNPLRKLMYSSKTPILADSSRISTSHSSIMIMNFCPLVSLIRERAFGKVFILSDKMPG